jgi:hypothetical protein
MTDLKSYIFNNMFLILRHYRSVGILSHRLEFYGGESRKMDRICVQNRRWLLIDSVCVSVCLCVRVMFMFNTVK